MRTRFYQKITSLLLVLFMCCFAGFIISATNTNSKVHADQPQGFELAGAEVRSDTPAGIRFVTNVSDSFYTAHSGDVFGTLVIPTNLLGENEDLSLETVNAQNIVTQNWKVKPGSGDTYQYTSTLIGKDMTSQLPVKEWNRKLTAISYVWDGENLSSVVYSNAEERSLAEVAAGVLASGEIDTDEEGFLRTICDTVIGENTFAFSEGTEITKKDLEEQVTLTLTGNQGLKAVYTSNSADITVDENGVVSATAYGTATITATIGTKTAEIEVTYVEPVATSLSFNQDSIELYASKNFRNRTNKTNVTSLPEITVLDQDGATMDSTKVNIAFSGNNASAATVATDGTITSVKSGTAVITATVNGLSDTLTVYVRDVIMSKSDLDDLAYSSRSGWHPFLDTNTYYVLTQDIDYNDEELKPIGVNAHLSGQFEWGRTDYGTWNDTTYWFPFKGTIDGRGHVIKNAYIPSMVIVSSQNEFTMGAAFIGKLTGTLKNIGFVNLRTKLVADEATYFNTACTRAIEKITDTQISSGLVSTNQGTLENIYLDMKIYKKSYGAYCCGALVGNAEKGTIKNCIVKSEKDYSVTGYKAPLTPGNYIDFGAVIGINSNTTITNVFAVSSSLTKFNAKDSTNTVSYTNVADLVSAKSAEIGAFGGYWTLNGTELKFGSTVIS